MRQKLFRMIAEFKSKLLALNLRAKVKAVLDSVRTSLPLLFISGLLSILMLGCSVASIQDAPQTSTCNVPLSHLEPTPQPPLSDETNESLIAENDQVRAALEEANGDKARVKRFIVERCGIK